MITTVLALVAAQAAVQGNPPPVATLYVQKTAELRLTAGGPVIGHAYPGAEAKVTKQWESVAQISIRSFAFQTMNTIEPGDRPLQALIDRAALGETRRPLSPPPRRGEVRRTQAFTLSTDTQDMLRTQFVRTRACEDTFVLEQHGRDRHALQYSEGFEVEGWSFDLQDARCLKDPVGAGAKVAPPGYLILADRRRPRLKDVLPAAFWVPVVRDGRAVCLPAKRGAGELRYTETDGAPCSWAIDFEDDGLTAMGPACTRQTIDESGLGVRGTGAAGGGFQWVYLGRRKDRLLFVEGGGDELFAIHPDDAAELFLDAKTCEREATVGHAFVEFQ